MHRLRRTSGYLRDALGGHIPIPADYSVVPIKTCKPKSEPTSPYGEPDGRQPPPQSPVIEYDRSSDSSSSVSSSVTGSSRPSRLRSARHKKARKRTHRHGQEEKCKSRTKKVVHRPSPTPYDGRAVLEDFETLVFEFKNWAALGQIPRK